MNNTFLNKLMFSKETMEKINSLTKYPSILTYHNLGPKGSLVDSLVEDKSFGDNLVYITEKIDGTNSRVIISTDEHGNVEDYLIGSREELLYAMGDRIINPAMGLINNMKPIAEYIKLYPLRPNSLYCLYGETYGGKINGAKQYSKNGSYKIRIFDLAIIEHSEVEELLEMSIEQISSWREHQGQPFVSVDDLRKFCYAFDLSMVPYISVVYGEDIPTSLQSVWDWMQKFKKSSAVIDETGEGLAEGVVIRLGDRSLIRKLRFEDYTRSKKIGLIK